MEVSRKFQEFSWKVIPCENGQSSDHLSRGGLVPDGAQSAFCAGKFEEEGDLVLAVVKLLTQCWFLFVL